MHVSNSTGHLTSITIDLCWSTASEWISRVSDGWGDGAQRGDGPHSGVVDRSGHKMKLQRALHHSSAPQGFIWSNTLAMIVPHNKEALLDSFLSSWRGAKWHHSRSHDLPELQIYFVVCIQRRSWSWSLSRNYYFFIKISAYMSTKT